MPAATLVKREAIVAMTVQSMRHIRVHGVTSIRVGSVAASRSGASATVPSDPAISRTGLDGTGKCSDGCDQLLVFAIFAIDAARQGRDVGLPALDVFPRHVH